VPKNTDRSDDFVISTIKGFTGAAPNVCQWCRKFISPWSYSPMLDHRVKLTERLKSERFKVIVLGEFKRGKSTLINSLLELLNEQFVRIANSVRGNPEYGVDSPFYRALGFVPKSERKRPRRRSNPAAVTAPDVGSPADAA
jgi:hypothetical protein